MQVGRNDWKVIQRAVDEWEQEGKLTTDKAKELRESVAFEATEKQQLANYFFFIALFCGLLAFGAIFIDDKLLERFKRYFSLSDIIIVALTAAIAIVWFWYVRRKRQKLSYVSYELNMIPGALAAITSLVYICKEINVSTDYAYFLGGASVLFVWLSVWFRSQSLWVVAVMAAMGWYGYYTEQHAVNNLFLDMNYALRFTAFGGIVLLIAAAQTRIKALRFTVRITLVAGLIILLTGLWGASVYGNYGNIYEWEKIKQIHVLVYGIIFGIISAIVFYCGIRYKDNMVRDMGIIFLLLNLYSRYFEFFWDTMNKGIFFLVLAVTFGFIGRWLTRGSRKKKSA